MLSSKLYLNKVKVVTIVLIVLQVILLFLSFFIAYSVEGVNNDGIIGVVSLKYLEFVNFFGEIIVSFGSYTLVSYTLGILTTSFLFSLVLSLVLFFVKPKKRSRQSDDIIDMNG